MDIRVPRDYNKQRCKKNSSLTFALVSQKSKMAIVEDIEAYRKRPHVNSDIKAKLLESCIAGDVDIAEEILKTYQIDIETITGKMEQI